MAAVLLRLESISSRSVQSARLDCVPLAAGRSNSRAHAILPHAHHMSVFCSRDPSLGETARYCIHSCIDTQDEGAGTLQHIVAILKASRGVRARHPPSGDRGAHGRLWAISTSSSSIIGQLGAVSRFRRLHGGTPDDGLSQPLSTNTCLLLLSLVYMSTCYLTGLPLPASLSCLYTLKADTSMACASLGLRSTQVSDGLWKSISPHLLAICSVPILFRCCAC